MNKRSTKPLSGEVKAKVLELYSEGFGQSEIAERLGIGRSSVYRIIKAAEEEELAAAATATSSEWECVTSDTLTINNNTTDKALCQALLDNIDTAMKMLLECALGEDVYSSTKAAYDIGGAVRKLQDAYNKLEEVIYENN